MDMDMELHDLRHLQAVEGWLGLDDIQSAAEELAAVSPEVREHPAVLTAQCQIYVHSKQWDEAAELAKRLTALLPEEPAAWIWLAYATRRRNGGGVRDAKEILVLAQPMFLEHYMFPFNLACYCAQLGEFDDAEQWLRQASAINKKAVRKLAADDADLKPLWEHLGGTIWKEE